MQENWTAISRFIRNYLLSASVPLMFDPIHDSLCRIMKKNYEDLTEKERPNLKSNEARNVWENLLKELLVDVFVQRLLGSQAKMEALRERSDRCLDYLNDLLGTEDPVRTLPQLVTGYMELLQDYLLRNMSHLPENKQQMSLEELVDASIKIYEERKMPDNMNCQYPRDFYVPFMEQPYTRHLLLQIYHTIRHPEEYDKCKHFLTLAEYIHTLFMFVYMIEYVKMYPLARGKEVQVTKSLEHDKVYNLFTALVKKEPEFKTAYDRIMQEKAEKEAKRLAKQAGTSQAPVKTASKPAKSPSGETQPKGKDTGADKAGVPKKVPMEEPEDDRISTIKCLKKDEVYFVCCNIDGVAQPEKEVNQVQYNMCKEKRHRLNIIRQVYEEELKEGKV